VSAPRILLSYSLLSFAFYFSLATNQEFHFMASHSTASPAATHPGVTTQQVYILASASLLVGLFLGYFQLGRHAAPTVAGAQVAQASKPSMGGHPKLTLEQMKQMADVQASALIEKSKTDPKNAALLVQKLRSASVGALQRLTALGARGQAASCRDIYLHLFLTRDAAWCAQGRWHSMQHIEYFPPHTKRVGGQHTCFSYDTPFTCA
jgi:hypothetical protein